MRLVEGVSGEVPGEDKVFRRKKFHGRKIADIYAEGMINGKEEENCLFGRE